MGQALSLIPHSITCFLRRTLCDVYYNSPITGGKKNQGSERLSDSLKVIQLVDPRLEHGFAGLLGPCSSLPITLHRAVLDVPLRQCQTPACVNCGVALLCPLQSCGRRSAMGRYYPKALGVSTHPGAIVKRQG